MTIHCANQLIIVINVLYLRSRKLKFVFLQSFPMQPSWSIRQALKAFKKAGVDVRDLKDEKVSEQKPFDEDRTYEKLENTFDVAALRDRIQREFRLVSESQPGAEYRDVKSSTEAKNFLIRGNRMERMNLITQAVHLYCKLNPIEIARWVSFLSMYWKKRDAN
mgnify:CR=1 FL=1